jgi:hypothetical protein
MAETQEEEIMTEKDILQRIGWFYDLSIGFPKFFNKCYYELRKMAIEQGYSEEVFDRLTETATSWSNFRGNYGKYTHGDSFTILERVSNGCVELKDEEEK